MPARKDRAVDAERGQLLNSAWHAYEEMMRAARSTARLSWLDLDLTVREIKTILLLAAAGPMPISKVADALRMQRPAASVLIDGLVKEGLVNRVADRTDRRYYLASLTPQGVDLVKRLHQGEKEQLAAWFAQLDSADLEALIQGMSALVAAAHEAECGREGVTEAG